MKRPRASTVLAFGAVFSATTFAQSDIVSPTNNNMNDNDSSDRISNNLMIKLSSSPSEADAPQIPLVGIGVGNLPHNRIPFLLATAMDSKQPSGEGGTQYQLVDTSHTNPALEVLVGRSLGRLLSNNVGKGHDYHVIIKIWHTHLGYERTMLSVHDSLTDILPEDFSSDASFDPSSWKKNPQLKVHAIIQYPRCYDTLFSSNYYQTSPCFPIKYSNCHEEEEAFAKSTSVNEPSPLDDKLAWKKSYRALEELYHRGIIESIGVSNFGPSDMNALYDFATVGPHLYMGSLRTLLEEDELVEEMVKHGVHYICYDAVSTVFEGKQESESAFAKLERMGVRHGVAPGEGNNNGYSAVQILLGWLVQRGVGIVPGTTDTRHLMENSPHVLSSMPKFSPVELLDVEMAVQALVSGEDLEELEHVIKKHDVVMTTGDEGDSSGIVATFFNSLKRNVRIFRVHPTTGRQIQLSSSIAPGRNGRILVDANDVLIAYDGHGTAVKKFLVEADEGVGRVDFAVEL
jgi:diketogulonate reductase-like aldo/keto reductase